MVSVWGIERFLLGFFYSVWAIWCHTFLTRLTLRAGNKLWNQLSLHMLKGQKSTHKQQHCHIKSCSTVSDSSINISSFIWVISLSFLLIISDTYIVQYVFTCFVTNMYRHAPKQILHHWTQTTDIFAWTLCGQQETAVFSPLTVKQEEISHRFPVLLLPSHLPSSQWCSFLKKIWFPTFVHLSFLRGPRKIALIPFTWENPDLHYQPPWRGKLFLSIASSKSPPGWHGNAASHLHRLTTMCLQT